MSLETLIKRGIDTPVDFEFIKRVVGKSTTIRMVDHESGLPNAPSLAQVFKGHQAVAICTLSKEKPPLGIGYYCFRKQTNVKSRCSILSEWAYINCTSLHTRSQSCCTL